MTSRLEEGYQVLHVLLHLRHGLLGAHGEHKRVHVVIVQRDFNLLRTETQSHGNVMVTKHQQAASDFSDVSRGVHAWTLV